MHGILLPAVPAPPLVTQDDINRDEVCAEYEHAMVTIETVTRCTRIASDEHS
jgi:hypothetical protein